MKRTQLIITGILLIIICAGSYYYLKRIYFPKQRSAEWEKKTAALISENLFKDGDLVFQSSVSRQTKAIQLATHSKWSHVGIVFKDNGDFFVYEAVQPVKVTPLAKWLSRSTDGIFAVKRIKNADSILTPENISMLRSEAVKFLGKNYDIYFEWTDEKIYCSEMVFKTYKNALNIEIGNTEKLKNFDLSNDEVKNIMNERYGNDIPLNEDVISPVSMFNSDKLIQIYPK